jgi:heptosyltransferase-2
MAAPNWENVLLLQTSFLGDTVLTLPLIGELRRRFPVKKLTLLCQPQSQELLQDHPAIDEIIVDDKKNADRGWTGLRAKAGALRAKGFTLALTPHKSLRSALLLYWARIPFRVGFRQSNGWFFFHRRAERDACRHDVERNLGILKALGVNIEDCERSLDLPVSPAVREAVNQKFRGLGLNDNEMLVGVNPGSVWPTKRWSASGFASLILLLKEHWQCQILLFGGPEDAAVVADVQERCAGGVTSLVNQISLRELPAAISRCAVFVTNDSGPMHIAVGRKVPTVAIFCATTPEQGFYPYSADAIIIQRELSCRPCSSHGGRRCPLGHARCITQVPAAKVFEGVRKLMSSDGSVMRPTRRGFEPEILRV